MTSSAARSENYSQFIQVRAQVNTWAVQGVATSLGADLNRDVRSCHSQDDLERLEEIYRTDLGPPPAPACPHGHTQHYGREQFYEADRRDNDGSGGPDRHAEPTLGSKKLDYFFVGHQRFYADYGAKLKPTSYSDHKPLHAAVTIH